ncbi:hypothetical protein FNV43_RR05931 [Rhamnella rubrinervis]|uniref:F-box domain-containing protein n=1 Tax=Rhamnella rubrinervis TaxID=2594499 RepID=A0A8K0HC29_9ROSA|nr:hypothetical protein FNV43_RR05931 [Rhamnella rubrinervis]
MKEVDEDEVVNGSIRRGGVSSVPLEIIEEILLKIASPKLLMRFKCVCKSWLSLIRDSRFPAMHLRLHPGVTSSALPVLVFRLPQATKYSLNNANFCVHDEDIGGPPIFSHPDHELRVAGGLRPCYKGFPVDGQRKGYVVGSCNGISSSPLMDDDKVLSVRRRKGYVSNLLRVYLIVETYWSSSGVVNGQYLHWSVEVKHQNKPPREYSIVCFDPEREVSQLLNPPVKYSAHDEIELGKLFDCLTLLQNFYSPIDVWVMKQHGVAASRTKLFTINTSFVLSLSLSVLDTSGKHVMKNTFEGGTSLEQLTQLLTDLST